MLGTNPTARNATTSLAFRHRSTSLSHRTPEAVMSRIVPGRNDFTFALGPIFPNISVIQSESEWYSYRARCFSPDFRQALSSAEWTIAGVEDLLNIPTLHDFRAILDAHIHFGGYVAVGGDLSDIFSSQTTPPSTLITHNQSPVDYLATSESRRADLRRVWYGDT